MTAERRRERTDDGDAARSTARHAGVTYGPRDSRRGPRDVTSDWVRGFIRRYGWRAYALPVLFVLTIAALMTTSTVAKNNEQRAASGGDKGAAAPPVADPRIALKDDKKGANFSDTVLKAAALPAGPAYTEKGAGTFRVLPGTMPKIGSGKLFRYSIDVEKGIAGVDLAQYAKVVDDTMADPRSWAAHGVTVQRVDSGPSEFHVTLTSAMTVRKLCGYDLPVETSCYVTAGSVSGLDVNRAVFNVARWVRGSTAYLGDLSAYRLYMVNHENGHALGHNHAHQCLPGGLAPIMMQQTFGLRSTRTQKLCQANPWPYPLGVRGAPGAEQQDTQQNNEYGRGD